MPNKYANYFHGKTVLITGASSGIGEALARALAPTCHKLILVARNRNKLQQLQETLGQKCQVVSLCLDITDEGAIENLANCLLYTSPSPRDA